MLGELKSDLDSIKKIYEQSKTAELLLDIQKLGSYIEKLNTYIITLKNS